MQPYLPVIFVLIFTPWIGKLYYNPVLVIVTLSTTFIFYKYILGVPKNLKRIYLMILILLFGILSAFQLSTTNKQRLLELSNDDIRYRQEKLNSYPPIKITVGNKTIWIPAAHWFEGRYEYLLYYRLERNLFENLDINNYFFANTPRPRVGVDEFEKLLYIFLPFFLYGIYQIIKSKVMVIFLLTLPLLFFLSFIGNSNPYGPVVLFPIMVVATAFGMKPVFEHKRKIYLYFLIGITFLAYIQIHFYERF